MLGSFLGSFGSLGSNRLFSSGLALVVDLGETALTMASNNW